MRPDRRPVRLAGVPVALALLLVAAAPPLAAQSNAATRWQAAIKRADKDLQAGRWDRVTKKMDRLLDEMLNSIESGPGAGWYLGSGAALRAVAEAGLGNARDAAWDWHMAITLEPDYEGMDLTRYGAGGEALLRALGVAAVQEAADPSREMELSPPRKLHAPLPAYPFAKRKVCIEEAVMVLAIVRVDGIAVQPRLLTPDDPVMGFAAMEALRSWRFEPAKLGGEPVASLFNLTTNFAMQRCSDVAGQGLRRGRGRPD